MKLRLGDTDRKTTGSASVRSQSSLGKRPSYRPGRGLFTFFIFILISLGFWLLQSLQSTYRMRITVPIVYDDLPPNIGYNRHGLAERIVFIIEDKGVQLLAYNFKDFEPLRVLRTEHRGAKGKLTLSKRQLMDELQRQLSSTTRILSVSPPEISIDCYELKERRVPVELGFDPPVPIGYQLTTPIIEPAMVSIYGDADAISAVKAVYTEVYNLSELKTGTDFSVNLVAPLGIEMRVKKVNVTLKVEQLTERSFDLPIEAIDVPTELTMRPLPSRAKLYVTLPAERFSILEAKDFALAVSYQSVTDSISSKKPSLLPVQLRMKPDWVVRYRIEPTSVQYILETNGRPADTGNHGRDR